MNLSAVGSLLITIVSFIVAIGILVAVHEFGHFWVARRVGIRVLRFSIGFGKPLWRRVANDGVEYVIASIPLGGYVKLLDEREGNVAPQDLPQAFNRQPVWKRVATLLAGPAANLAFAVFAYWLILMAGVPALKPVIGEVAPESAAAEAGLRDQDLITHVGGREVQTREAALLTIFQKALDGHIELRVKGADGASRQVSLRPHPDQQDMGRLETLLSSLGFDFWRPNIPAVVGKLVEGGAAQRAGLQVGDEVVAFDGKPVRNFNELLKLVMGHVNRPVVLTVQRKDERLELPVKVAEETVDGRSIGRIGMQAQATTITVPEELRTVVRQSEHRLTGR